MVENKQKYIKREIFSELKAHMTKSEVTMIIGPRQCGKTTIMHQLVDSLNCSGKKTLFLNLDLEQDKRHLESQEKLLAKIKLEFGSDEGIVFIDEIQRKKDAGIFLKGLYDMKLAYKFVVSGSGNVEIKEQVSESLMGRKRMFKMVPVTFTEFVNFKTNYAYEDRIDDFFNIETEKVNLLLNEYMNFGGYPKVILAESLKEKQLEISEIYQSYINQDIINWLKVEKIESFEKLAQLSASQIGNMVEYSSLANSVDLSTETARNYLWYLRKTFILKKCKPFYTNKKREITKSPIFYFYDMGLRNYVINKFGTITDESHDAGFVFENYVFNVLHKMIQHTNTQINFWRTKSQAEVDFVINFGEEQIPIEVKFQIYTKPTVGKSMRSFIEKYNPKVAFIITKNYKDEIVVGATAVRFLPFWAIGEIFNSS